MFKHLQTAGAVAVGTLLASPVFAAAVDVAAVETDIEAQITPIVTLGSAVLLVIVAIKAFKWVRRAM